MGKRKWRAMRTSVIEMRDFGNRSEVQNLRLVLWTLAALGLLFQVGHFFEHAFQSSFSKKVSFS
jgi:hypothetical protein